MIKKIKAFTITFLLLLTSCSNFLEHEADDIKNSIETEESSPSVESRKTYISINIGNKTASRTIRPQNISIDKLTNFTLYGTAEGQELLGAPLMSAPDYANLPDRIEITPGHWAFSLTANYGNAIYAAQTEVDIISDIENHIAFVLKPQGEWGSFSLTVDLSSNTEISKVNAKLQTVAGEDIDSQVFHPEPENPVINYSQINLNPGTYMVSFEFFGDENDPTPIDNWESYIIIKAGTITEDTINLDLNLLWTIDYEFTDADGADGEFTGGFQITKYSARSCFDLPKGRSTTDNRTIIGWRINGEGALLTKIEPGNYGDMTLQAVYGYNELYVSNNISGEAGADVLVGDDDNNTGFTADSPLFSIDTACQKIIENGNPEVEWTIYIIGSVATKDANASGGNLYKSSTISDTITSEHAKSILITGAREPDANGLPVDEINRKPTGISSSTTALVVSTSVPVTIKNLKITHGKGSSSSGDGGALRVETGATVTLEDGVWLHDNNASNAKGGAVYNVGTMYITGSTVIGDPNATTNTTGGYSNSAQYGGGIYNAGSLYLGYSNYVSETVNTPKEWTGGVTYNSAEAGGAIFNAEGGTIVMKSGRLAYCAGTNTTGTTGGGAVANKGTFTMNGGVIESNSTDGTTGGGFKNFQNSTFYFAGGSIKSNKTKHNYGSTYPSGGGVQNEGNMYVYGNAVIGDASATTAATDADHCSNFAVGYGGGIFVSSTGKLYLGYKSFTSLTENEPETWNGGIYYNYTSYNCDATGGGGIGTDGGTIYMHSGTIANNGTVYKNPDAGFNYDGKGAAVYQSGNFYIGGSASIPAGEDSKQDIYINNYTDTKIVTVSGRLADTFSATITPYYYESGSTQKPALSIASGADTDYDTERGKFEVTPQVDASANMTTYWMIDESGKLARNSGAFPFQINFEKPSFSTVGLYTKYRAESQLKDNEGNLDLSKITGGSTIPSSGVPIGNYVGIYTTNNLYSNFEWHIDGKSISEVSSASTTVYNSHADALLIINTTGWTPGYHDITLDVLDSVGHYVSVVYQLKLAAN